MSEPRPPADQLLDLVLYAPIGLLAVVRDDLPKLVAQGRREVDLARMIGRFAVQQGEKELRKRFGGAPTRRPAADDATTPPARATAPPSATTSTTKVAVQRPVPAGPPSPKSRKRPVPTPRTGAEVVAATSLPIADYDSLAASQVVARLEALTLDELRAVEGYEIAGRGRRTVLGKITQLTSSR